MSFTKITDAAVRVIRNLPNRPTGTGRMSAAALKAAFDQAAESIKRYVNSLIDELQAATAAGQIGFARSAAVPADTVQDAVENVQGQIAGVSQGAIPNNSITAEKMHAGAIEWIDVSQYVNLEYNYGPHDAETTRHAIQRKNFRFAPALGMVRYVVTIRLTTTGLAYYIPFKQTGQYMPNMVELNGGAAAVSGLEGTGGICAEYSVDAGQGDAALYLATEKAVDKLVTVSGWYFCEGA